MIEHYHRYQNQLKLVGDSGDYLHVDIRELGHIGWPCISFSSTVFFLGTELTRLDLQAFAGG